MEPLQDGELMLLAKDVPHIEFSQLCDALGTPFARGQKILATHLSDYDVAVQQLLIEWKMKQTDPTQSRTILARKLRDVGLGALGEKLSQGGYQPYQCDPRDKVTASSSSVPDIYSKKISESLTVWQCREKLVNKYMNSFCKIQRAPWDPSDLVDFEDLHTVVTMVNKDAHGRDNRKKEILHGSVGEIFSTKVNGVLPRRIVISAPAGRGKTTAVAKMAYEWAYRVQGSSLENLPLLFAVKLQNTNQQTSIAEAIRSQLLSDVADLTQEGLHRFIAENQGICHIILDGLDGYAGISANQGLGSNIVDVMLWEEFPDCRVLVTTRPNLEKFFNQGELPRVYTKMWIEGFSHDSSREYIDRFFASISNPSNAQGLKAYLDGQPLINELVITPLFCLMVCHLWSEGLLRSDTTTTQTGLLDRVNLFFMRHANAQSNDKIITEEKLGKIICELGEVALAGLLEDAKKRIFTPHDFRKIPAILDKACELGIISKATVTSERLKKSSETITTIKFYHELAQEHSAGKYLAAEFRKRLLPWQTSWLERVLSKKKASIGDYENLIRFAAGSDDSLCIRIMERLLANSFLDESERCRILLDCSAEASGTDGRVSSILQRCVTAQRMVLKSPTVYTVVGMQNLPEQLKYQIREVSFEDSAIYTDVTIGLWSCLGSFPTLRSLTISDSSLSFHFPIPVLPSVTKLKAQRVTSHSYEELLSSLPGLEEMNITVNNAEKDIPVITASLRRMGGQQLSHIRLHAPSSLPSGKKKLSRETMRELGLLIRDQIENLQVLGLSGVQCQDEDDLIDLVESCRHIRTMDYLELVDCGSKGGGRLESYINELLNSQESFRVFLSHSNMHTEFTTNPPGLDTKGQDPESPSSPSGTATDTQPQSHEDLENSTNGYRIIRLDEYSVEVRIPLDEADGLGDVVVEALTTTPPDLVLNENEVIISVGLTVSSSKRTFKTPVKVTLPHCAFFTNPEKAELVLYNRNTDSDRFVATPCSTVGIPRCVVRKRDLDLYVGHFSILWLTAIKNKICGGKYVFFTPYIPEVIHRNEEHLLHLCIRDKTTINRTGIADHKIAYCENMTFLVKWRRGDIVITYNQDQKEEHIKNIPLNKFHYRTDVRPYFPLNIDDVRKSLIRLIVKQKFTTGEPDISVEFFIYITDDRLSNAIPPATPGPSIEAGTVYTFPGDEEEVTDECLLQLSKRLLPDVYNDIHVVLGVEYSIAADIRGKNISSSDKYYDLFQKWKVKSRRTGKDLKEVLKKANLGGLTS